MAQEINSFFFKIRMIPAKCIQIMRYLYYKLRGYDIRFSTSLERGLNLDRINPKGIHIGEDCIITSNVTILSHYLRAQVYTDNNGTIRTKYVGEVCDTYIGHSCVIGIGAIILGGTRIGNYCVIGAGAVVSKDVPDNTIVAGNPAKVVKEEIEFDGKRI